MVQQALHLSSFRFEKRLHGLLAILQLSELGGISSLFALGGNLSLHDALSSLESLVHGVNVHELALQPYVGLSVWILELGCASFDSTLEVLLAWVGQHSLLVILVRVVLEPCFLKLHHMGEKFICALVLSVTNSFHRFHLLSLHFHDADGFLEVLLEDHDSILVPVRAAESWSSSISKFALNF